MRSPGEFHIDPDEALIQVSYGSHVNWVVVFSDKE